MCEDGGDSSGSGADALGAWFCIGGGSEKETRRWKSTLQSLRRRNAWRIDDDLASQIAALGEENRQLRAILQMAIDMLVAKGVADAQELAPLVEALKPPLEEAEQKPNDTSEDLLRLARLVTRD